LAIALTSIIPGIDSKITPLVPALQSNWLTIHVTTCFFGYASFAVSFGISILYLIRDKKRVQKEKVSKWLPSTPILDEINYKSIVIGFPMLTLGIVTGAAWANYAWGSYWSWDPKETWSLITWFIYAAFLHARLTRDWRGRRAAILSIVGFTAVLFTYFGVNYLISGLHSYL
jgi:cytochrome c-type biogenesis protein CcsB